MSELNINDERSVRLHKLESMLDKHMEAYPSRAKRTHTAEKALEAPHGEVVSVVGKIMLKRSFGKLSFCKLQDESGTIQVVFKEDSISAELFGSYSDFVDMGDIISVTGERFETQKGEQSVLATDWAMLSKALRPLPDKHKGLQDEETRLRKRYLELVTDPELRELFRKKSKFWQTVRNFLLEEGFLEVETPVLESTPGGADAEPFVTHHNALDIDVYLRISMGELWQKRLMVGGFEKTFEIGRQFRNEGMSREHLQDYTQMEFYWAYANYEDSMEMVERMYKKVLSETFGTTIFTIGEFEDIDVSKPWEQIDYVQTIEEKFGINVLDCQVPELEAKLKELHVSFDEGMHRGRLVDLLWKQVRKSIKGPVFLVNHPVDVSPLAKRKANDPRLTERYQIIIAGSELGNGYSELNDPIDQRGRFEMQAQMREEGDTEAQMHDESFVEALEYAMPPTTGFGLSERVFSFFSNKPIRECVLFPLMRPEHEQWNDE